MGFKAGFEPSALCVWVSRVRPGKCYHLYNSLRASLMDAYQLPEIMRTPLEELCLQIKVSTGGGHTRVAGMRASLL